MATNTVTISGMFGSNHTYFANSPVVIDISGLYWGDPVTSPFTIVRVEVVYNNSVVGSFRADTGGQTNISFDISSALRAIWSDYDFTDEVKLAQAKRDGKATRLTGERPFRIYFLRVYTEYLASDDGGVFTTTTCTDSEGNTAIPGGRCMIGRLTEWERDEIMTDERYTTEEERRANADAAYWEHTGVRNGDASTKPVSSLERVGKSSITSWVDVDNARTKHIFYPADTDTADDDELGNIAGWMGHAPLVARDPWEDYVDFLFVNRRGAVETCSGRTLESMKIEAQMNQYGKVERPRFAPSQSIMSIPTGDGRRSWAMSSGYQTREWAEWWVLEFLHSRRVWMLYRGRYVPVTVKSSNSSVTIYDLKKGEMPHVDFTVTLALEG